jgi:multiple sugar transport system substrate-binding protein
VPTRLILLLATVSLIGAACGGGGNTSPGPGSPGGTGVAGGSPRATGVATGSPAATDAGESPAGTDAGESPAGTDAGESPAETAAASVAVTPPPTPTIACAPQGARTLTVGAAYGGADEIAKTRYDYYCDQAPDVTISFTEQQFSRATFVLDVAAGTAPDLVKMGRDIIGEYIAQGALEPLDQCIADHSIDMGQYYDAAVNQVTSEGVVYGIPEFFNIQLVLTNNSVLDEAGLAPEDINTSDWDRLREINEQLLVNEGGLSRIGFDPKLPEFLPLWARANGASIISDDGLTSQLNDPLVAEALEYAASLVLAHGSQAEFFDFRANGPGGVDFFGAENQFAEDTLGAFPIEVFYLNVLANNSPEEEVGFQPFRARDGSEIAFGTGDAWAIPTNSENKDDACEFMKQVTSPEAWIAASRARAELRAAEGEAYTGTYSGNEIADETIFGEIVTAETAGNFYEGVQLVVELMPNADSLPPIPNGAAFQTAWQDAVQRVLRGEMSAADSLAQAHEEAQQAIDEGRP